MLSSWPNMRQLWMAPGARRSSAVCMACCDCGACERSRTPILATTPGWKPPAWDAGTTLPRRASYPGVAAPVTYRVEFGVGAQAQFHTLAAWGRDALIDRAVQLSEQPWDAVIRPPGHRRQVPRDDVRVRYRHYRVLRRGRYPPDPDLRHRLGRLAVRPIQAQHDRSHSVSHSACVVAAVPTRSWSIVSRTAATL